MEVIDVGKELPPEIREVAQKLDDQHIPMFKASVTTNQPYRKRGIAESLVKYAQPAPILVSMILLLVLK